MVVTFKVILLHCFHFCWSFFIIVLTLQVLHLNEEMKVFELQILEYKKKEVEAESRLKEQQNIYEAVRNDRNVFSKHLIETKVSPSPLL